MFCDGSVRSINVNTDAQVLRRLASRCDGEVAEVP